MKSKLIIFFCVFFLCSCKKDSGVQSTGGSIYSINLESGGTTTYLWSLREVDSLGKEVMNDKDSLAVRVVGMGETQGRFTNLTCLEARSLLKKTGVSKTWYLQTKDSLIEVAYSGAGRVPLSLPKKGEIVTPSQFSIPASLWRLWSKKMPLDSVQIRDEVRVVYHYPLNSGKKWVSFHKPFYSPREVVTYEWVTLKAGMFFCAKIKTTIEEEPSPWNLEWYDYVSWQGLVLRTLFFPRITIVDEAGLQSKGWITTTERLELVSRN